jgi:hypothetical protein
MARRGNGVTSAETNKTNKTYVTHWRNKDPSVKSREGNTRHPVTHLPRAFERIDRRSKRRLPRTKSRQRR